MNKENKDIFRDILHQNVTFHQFFLRKSFDVPLNKAMNTDIKNNKPTLKQIIWLRDLSRNRKFSMHIIVFKSSFGNSRKFEVEYHSLKGIN